MNTATQRHRTTPARVTPRKREMLNRIADQLEDYLSWSSHPLRPPQVQVMRDIIASARRGEWGGSVIRPTGTGKTIIFSAVVQALQDLRRDLEAQYGPGNEHGCLILVPTTYLAEQTYEVMVNDKRKDGRPLFGFQPEEVGVLRSIATDTQKGQSLAAPNLIMTYNYFNSLDRRAREELTSRFFTIMDEVDVAKGDQRSPLFSGWTSNNYTLGFSATDKFIEQEELRSINDVLFEGRPPIHRTTLSEAAKTGEIAPTRNVLFVTDLDSGMERKVRGTTREYTQMELNSIVDQPGRDDAAIRAIAGFVDPNNGIAFKDLNQIWFCLGVNHAARIATRLNHIYQQTLPDGSLRYPHGYAVSVSSETPRHDWVDGAGKPQLGLYSILEKHRLGEIPVLCNADLLIRGFDSPATQLCVMLRPTRSPTLTEQAGGRIARLDPANPNKLGYVATFFDRDTASAMCFTDVAGSVFIGPEGQEQRSDFRSSSTEDRKPDLKALDSNNKVEVITIFEPRRIESFLHEKRGGKALKHAPMHAPMRADFVTGSMMAKAMGLPNKYFDKEPLKGLYRAMGAVDPTGSEPVTYRHPVTSHVIEIPRDAIGVYKPPRGGGGTQLCLRRDIAERVFTRDSRYPRCPDGFLNSTEVVAAINPQRNKVVNTHIIDFFAAARDVWSRQIEGRSTPPTDVTITWGHRHIRVNPAHIMYCDTSNNFALQGWNEVVIARPLMDRLAAELAQTAAVSADDEPADELLARLSAQPNDPSSIAMHAVARMPANAYATSRLSPIKASMLADLPLGFSQLSNRIIQDDAFCAQLVERVAAAWRLHHADAAAGRPVATDTFTVPLASRIYPNESFRMPLGEVGYVKDDATPSGYKFFMTRQAIHCLTSAISRAYVAPRVDMDWRAAPAQNPSATVDAATIDAARMRDTGPQRNSRRH
jgi:superfamily II DNA or RNA helicase